MKLLKLLSITTTAIVLAMPSAVMAETIDFAAIQAQAAQIKQANELLNNPDPNLRLAALEAMLSSDNLAMREAAYTAGFASASDTIRAVTARKRFSELTTLVFELSLPENATEDQKKQFNKWAGKFDVQVLKYDEASGTFELVTDSTYKGSGNVSGIRLNFALRAGFSGKLSLNDESVYVGSVNYKDVSLPAKLTLQ